MTKMFLVTDYNHWGQEVDFCEGLEVYRDFLGEI